MLNHNDTYYTLHTYYTSHLILPTALTKLSNQYTMEKLQSQTHQTQTHPISIQWNQTRQTN